MLQYNPIIILCHQLLLSYDIIIWDDNIFHLIIPENAWRKKYFEENPGMCG
jgi:hypothetical protein